MKEKPYQSETLEKAKFFLIVCEGQTEEYYFRSFPLLTAVIKAFGIGKSNAELVKCALELSKLAEYKEYEIWCVFDFDRKPKTSL